jgi:predicted membrane protein
MDDSKRTSTLYCQGVAGVILVVLIIGAFILPITSFDPSEYIAVLQTNEFIAALLFYITILAAVTLGIAAMIYEIEEAQIKILGKLDKIVEKKEK